MGNERYWQNARETWSRGKGVYAFPFDVHAVHQGDLVLLHIPSGAWRKSVVAYPQPQHEAQWKAANAKVKETGPAENYGGVGSMEYCKSMVRDWKHLLDRLSLPLQFEGRLDDRAVFEIVGVQDHFKGIDRTIPGFNRSLVTRYGMWKKRAFAQVLELAQQQNGCVLIHRNSKAGEKWNAQPEPEKQNAFRFMLTQAAEELGFSIHPHPVGHVVFVPPRARPRIWSWIRNGVSWIADQFRRMKRSRRSNADKNNRV